MKDILLLFILQCASFLFTYFSLHVAHPTLHAESSLTHVPTSVFQTLQITEDMGKVEFAEDYLPVFFCVCVNL